MTFTRIYPQYPWYYATLSIHDVLSSSISCWSSVDSTTVCVHCAVFQPSGLYRIRLASQSTMHCAVHRTSCIVHCALCIAHCALCVVHCIVLCTAHCAAHCVVRCAPCIALCQSRCYWLSLSVIDNIVRQPGDQIMNDDHEWWLEMMIRDDDDDNQRWWLETMNDEWWWMMNE